jgi:hypothetical protein
MIFELNHVFSLWTHNDPTYINYKCWESVVNLGYHLTLYVDKHIKLPPRLASKINIVLLSSLPPSFSSFFNNNGDFCLQQTDIWRFMMLKHYGGTWIDSDLFLLKRLPHDKIIISSEHSLKSGAFKSKSHLKPNIGVLRFPPNNEFIKDVVNKLSIATKEDETSAKSINQVSKMLKFIKMLKSKKWLHMNQYVAEPEVYCPIAWFFTKELFTKDINDVVNDKYGVPFNNINDNTIGIHLWQNLATKKYKINLNEIHYEKPNSTYALL